ncbi:deoxyhypusine synthase [Thermofilum pendens]|uniref:Deoxyhypusine synthase n=1 Tax=Thermofilum pendens (strain DSM 2475 / Hrk 5) TaxID=368408 RepID=A1RX92_THEPD|nr:deoxyhypusine synthase [Thermofilum pendens]ABL77822.1 Deoxyhypusine synthase [Thermofilum pendens Hrk 5]
MEKEKIRASLLGEAVEDLRLADVSECSVKVLKSYRRLGGFSARYIVEAAELLWEAYSGGGRIAVAFPANLVATGLRGLIADSIRRGLLDLVVTTGGTFDHDIARGTGHKYYVGRFEIDDVFLKELGIHRLGNILIPVENYGPPIERFTHEMLEELSALKSSWSPSELAVESGKRLRDELSILRAVYEKGRLLVSPGVLDSAFGTAIVTFNDKARASSTARFVELDLISDERRIADYMYEAEKLAGLMLGGGISKHHLIWWAQFRGGLDYAVQITSTPEWDGSLSGARTREAVSWGKIKPEARHVTVPGDVTVILPLILGYLAHEAGIA